MHVGKMATYLRVKKSKISFCQDLRKLVAVSCQKLFHGSCSANSTLLVPEMPLVSEVSLMYEVSLVYKVSFVSEVSVVSEVPLVSLVSKVPLVSLVSKVSSV